MDAAVLCRDSVAQGIHKENALEAFNSRVNLRQQALKAATGQALG